MEYNSVEELLSTPADLYFEQYVDKPYYRTKIRNWLLEASTSIVENSRHGHEDKNKYERALVRDIIQYPSKLIPRWRNVSTLTIDVMNAALKINGLSLDMHPYKVAALLKNNDLDSDIDLYEKFAISLKALCQINEDEGFSIDFGKSLIPGYECTLTVKKLKNF